MEAAAERSKHNVSKTEMNTLMSLYEPTSLDKLVNKGESLHQRSMSPRGFRNSMNESDMVRRTSSYGIPAQDAIAERDFAELMTPKAI